MKKITSGGYIMAYFITPKMHQPERGRTDAGLYEFYKTVQIEKASRFTLRIFASVYYKLYINGKYICEGPSRSEEFTRYYDTIEVPFEKGENEIVFAIAHITEPISFATGFKSQKPVLVFDAVGDGESFFSDISWHCRYVENFRFNGDDTFVFPFEVVCGDRIYKEVPLEATRETSFDTHSVYLYGLPPFRLEKRPIPMIFPTDEITFKVVKQGENFIEYDCGEYVTANVKITLAPECEAKIIYAECYMKTDTEKGLRDDTSGFIKCENPVDMVTSGKNEFAYEPLRFRAFRFIRIETKTPEKVLEIKANRFNYPIKNVSTFTCSDDYFNKMVGISENTMRCCTTDVFVDCPYYEQQQYIMDSAVEAAVLMRMSGDTAPVRKCIREFAASQTPTGLLQANYPQAAQKQIIPGFSFFFFYLLNDYLEYSADTSFAKKYIGVLDKVITHFLENLDKNGLVTTSQEWDYVDWVPGWDTGTLPIKRGDSHAVYSLYFAYSLLTASKIARRCGRQGLADEYAVEYEKLCENIRKRLYVKERGMFHDGAGTFSMHTVIWAILSETVKGKEAFEMAEKLCDESIFKSSYSMNFFLFRALEKCGRYDMAQNYFDGWKKMIDLHCTTWCENPDSPRSECHGWSSAPLYEFSENILGVKAAFEDVIVIKPETLHLSFAKGCVPTRHGNVFVEWEKKADFSIKISSPEGVKKKLILPSGEETEFFDSEKFMG